MDSYAIGISGLTVSQKALDVIGNNIANAATEGYHKQRVELTPIAATIVGENVFGGGVELANITRSIDRLLEQEITRQQSNLEQTDTELSTLETIQMAFGDITEGGLGTKIDDFFHALDDLATHATDPVYQEQAVTSAEAMTNEFNNLGSFFNNQIEQITLEANNTIDEINLLSRQIADLNGTIEDVEVRGKQASNLRDQRDKYISDLSNLISIQTIQRDNGVTDVVFNGTTIVGNRNSLELAIKLQAGDNLGVSVKGDDNYSTDIQGGKLGGLFSLRNELIPEFKGQLDDIARELIQQINEQHVQGVGANGSFDSLTGWEMLDENLANLEPPITDGKIYARLTDEATGEISRVSIDVSSSDTLSDVAAKFEAISGLTASVISGKLHIEADNGYKFDFLPGVLSEPTTSGLTGTAVPEISGIYTGAASQTFTCTISGSGKIGVDSGLKLRITDAEGKTITVDIGQGYAGDSKLDIGNGLSVSFNANGTVVDGEQFTIEALAKSDETGLLAAAGINVFFTGQNAANISVDEQISSHPGNIATAIGLEMNDNKNVTKMAQLADTGFSNLENKSMSDYFRTTVSRVGQEINTREMESENYSGLLQNLSNQQDSVSGVNINNEAAELLVYERMFQASSRYMQTVKTSMDKLMSLLD